MMNKKIHTWHQTSLGLLFFSIINVGIMYLSIKLAFKTGNLFLYLIAIIFLISLIQNLINLIYKVKSFK